MSCHICKNEETVVCGYCESCFNGAVEAIEQTQKEMDQEAKIEMLITKTDYLRSELVKLEYENILLKTIIDNLRKHFTGIESYLK
jgi:hypothetical protein